jgi:hypothetical protein
VDDNKDNNKTQCDDEINYLRDTGEGFLDDNQL